MTGNIDKREWKEFLQNFSTRHRGSRTRLGVFEIRDGVVNDLWIEDGLPLAGIDIDTKDGRRTIGISFEHYSHSIENVSTITELGSEGLSAGLDIEDDEGNTTALRLEDYMVKSED
jgi:hypothetical protein